MMMDAMMMMIGNNRVAHVQLRQWIEGETNITKNFSERGAGEFGYKLMTLRQTTVAYGIAELLKQPDCGATQIWLYLRYR